MENPPFSAIGCVSCGLYRTHPCEGVVSEQHDTRLEAQSGQNPHRVLFVYSFPTEADAKYGGLLQDNDTEWVRDYLNHSNFNWAVTCVNLCYPGRKDNKKVKPTLAQQEHCSANFINVVKEFNPQIVVALGGDALKYLWPSSRGEVPAITRARSTPVQVSGRWLVATYDPEQHGRWLKSGGKDGQDLTEEYIRCFTQIHDLLSGKFKQAPVEYTIVRDQKQLAEVADKADAWGVRTVYLDTEESTWLNFGNQPCKPHKEDPEGVEEERLTMHHPAAELIITGLTFPVTEWDTGKVVYKTFVTLPECWKDEAGQRILARIINNRHFEAWNSLHDIQSIKIFANISLCVPHRDKIPVNCTIGDGMLKRALPDQSRSGNGLKPTAQELASAPDWALELDQCKQVIRKQRLKAKEPGMVHMGMMPLEITAPYNANDTYQNAVLVEEKLTDEALGPDFPWTVYNLLIAGYPWILEMQHNGLPAQQHLFEEFMDEQAATVTRILAQLRSFPEVKRAESASGKKFNIRSNIFYKAFILDLFGVPDPTGSGLTVIPSNFPLTDGGEPSSKKETIAELAGEVVGQAIPWEAKTRTQRLFTKIIEWRKAGDDLTRIEGLYGYIVNDRIHTSFRIIKAETNDGDESGAGELDGGTRSGRIASSPNTQNLWPRVRHLVQAPKGKVWLKADYGRIELAWLAWNTKDPLMMEWARLELDQHHEKGRTLWAATFGRDPKEFDTIPLKEQKLWRKLGKTQNFATIYLEEPRTTAAKNNIPLGDVISALEISDRMNPMVRALKMKIYEDCQAGRMLTTAFGRRRSAYLRPKDGSPITWVRQDMTAEEWVSLDPDVANKRDKNNMDIYRSVWNTAAAQADASDMAYCMGTHIHNKLWGEEEWLNPEKVKSINFEHDCLVYEVDADYVDVAAPEIYRTMRDLSILPIEFTLPIPVDIKVGVIPMEVEPEDYDKYPNTLRPYKIN